MEETANAVEQNPQSEAVADKDNLAVLMVTPDGEFQWHPDADKLIAETDWSNNPAMPHMLRLLRKACAAGLTSE